MTFLYLNSDKMGDGDEVLGKKLMAAFLRELAASDTEVDVVGCVNAGINLTTKGSDVIDSLEAIQAKGAMIATCGTCLEHYEKTDELLIGEVGTMAGSVQVMTTADRIIRPN